MLQHRFFIVNFMVQSISMLAVIVNIEYVLLTVKGFTFIETKLTERYEVIHE